MLVLETFVRHDVTPVAGAVADAQQDRLVFALRALRRLPRPRDTNRPGYRRAAADRGWFRVERFMGTSFVDN